MSRQARASLAKPPGETTGEPESVADSLTASTQGRVAAEIADELIVLRARAQEVDLKFLCYLLEMAYIDAFEQSQKAGEQSPSAG